MHAPETARRTQVASIARISGPLIVNNLAVAGMNFADTVMSGRLGADALAAVAIGSNTWLLAFSACLGLLMAMSPIIARHFGAGEVDKIGRYARHGMVIGFGLGLLILVVGRPFVETFLTAVGIDTAFRGLTVDYVRVLLFGAPGILVFIALRFTIEGVGYTRPIMFTSMLFHVIQVTWRIRPVGSGMSFQEKENIECEEFNCRYNDSPSNPRASSNTPQ